MRFLALLKKDIKSEFRTKYAISALVLFVFTSIILIYSQISGEVVSTKVLAGLYWVVYFFASLTGFSRSFISEEEKSTSFFLISALPLESIWIGKLLFNIFLSILINITSIILFALFINGFLIENYSYLIWGHLLGGAAIASSLTILSALISKANSKSSILAIMSFPVILPAIISSANITSLSLGAILGTSFETEMNTLFIYLGLVLSSSWVLFDYIWKD